MIDIKKIDHLVLTTADRERCISFYKKLGFSSRENADRLELYAGDFKINVHLKGKELEPHASCVQTGSADLCFECRTELSQLRRQLEMQGIQSEGGIVGRTGVRGPMKSLYVRDSDGNLLEFCNYPAEQISN